MSSAHSATTNRRQSSGQEAWGGDGVDSDANLAVRLLAQRSAPLTVATGTDHRPSFGNETSSTTHASGPITGTIRSAIRRRTGNRIPRGLVHELLQVLLVPVRPAADPPSPAPTCGGLPASAAAGSSRPSSAGPCAARTRTRAPRTPLRGTCETARRRFRSRSRGRTGPIPQAARGDSEAVLTCGIALVVRPLGLVETTRGRPFGKPGGSARTAECRMHWRS